MDQQAESAVAAMREAYERRIAGLSHDIETLRRKYTEQIERLKSDAEGLKQAYSNQIAGLNQSIGALQLAHKQQIEAVNGEFAASQLRARAEKRTLGHEAGGASSLPTSVSDTEPYREWCALAADQPIAFATFRRHPILIEVMEHVPPAVGLEMLQSVRDRRPEYISRLADFTANDALGAPICEIYPEFGKIAPTTARYVKFLADMEDLFGSLDGFNIVEIGSGYGGQARIIHSRFQPASYTLLDLPEPGRLAQRYLQTFDINPVVNPPTADIASRPVDLLISNYALSEIRLDERQAYIRDVVKVAKRGFVMWNALASDAPLRDNAGESAGTENELLQAVTRPRVLRERPWISSIDRDVSNSLIVWGKTDD